MYYWPRSYVNERLKLAKFQSYRIIPATNSGRISSDYIVNLLNRTGVGIAAFRCSMPSDILTTEELVERYAESGITRKDVIKWSRLKRNPIPHYRLSRYAIRFSAADVDEWMNGTHATRKERSST